MLQGVFPPASRLIMRTDDDYHGDNDQNDNYNSDIIQQRVDI